MALLESPAFSELRAQILEPAKYPHLLTCLYGLLMLLPQNEAFCALRTRLAAVTTLQLFWAQEGVVARAKDNREFTAEVRRVVGLPPPAAHAPDEAPQLAQGAIPVDCGH